MRLLIVIGLILMSCSEKPNVATQAETNCDEKTGDVHSQSCTIEGANSISKSGSMSLDDPHERKVSSH